MLDLSNLIFAEKCDGLSSAEINDLGKFLAKPIECGEIQNGSRVDHAAWVLPEFQIPEEYASLLQHSNGGLIVNGDREFGFFGKETLREYYLNYEFPEYMPAALPIALNGGGVFYAYDFRSQVVCPKIVATSAGVLEWESAVVIGSTLAEVLAESGNIEDV